MKGTPLLLDYINLFRLRTKQDVRLVLTGSGRIDPPPELQPYISDLGFVSEADKRAVMEGALAFIHPSLHESLSIVLLESWLAQTPALVHYGGRVLRHQCEQANGGMWFSNYPEFEESLLTLLGNQQLRKKLGKAGREYVLRKYGWQTVMQRLLDAIEK